MATNATSLLPGRNPSGTNLAMDYSILPATGSTSGANPILSTANPTTLGTGSTGTNAYNPNPVPTFGANAGGYTSTRLTGGTTTGAGGGTGASGGATTEQFANLYTNLKKDYGPGIAGMITQFLQGGAGFNQDAVNNLLASMQPGIERGEEDLMEQFSTSGNRFGSGAQIGLGDYLSQVNLNEGEIEAQMYETSVSDYINTLMGTSTADANRKANQPTTWDTISNALPIVSGAANAESSAGVGGTMGSILDVIGGLG